jgi:dihydroorotase
VRPERFCSKSRNTPFSGRRLRGRTEVTIVGGEVAYQRT